jgi:hypothetical protein
VKKSEFIDARLEVSLPTGKKIARPYATGKKVRRNIVLWIRALTHFSHATGNFFRSPVNPGKAVVPERPAAIIITP